MLSHLKTQNEAQTREQPQSKPLSKQLHKQSTFWTDVEAVYFRQLEQNDVVDIFRAARKTDTLEVKRQVGRPRKVRVEEPKVSSHANSTGVSSKSAEKPDLKQFSEFFSFRDYF